jgi:DNA uptake protein ComE-like DNA-binding protein
MRPAVPASNLHVYPHPPNHPHQEKLEIDMKKITTIAAALLIGISGAAFAQKQEAPKAAPAAKADAKADAKAAPATEAKKEPLDLNTASEKDLVALPKIGDAKAKAIIKARPFGGKDELVAKKILTQAEYDGIKDLVIAKQAKKEEAKKDEPKKEAKKEEPKKEEKKK